MAIETPAAAQLRAALRQSDLDPADPATEKRIEDAFAFLDSEHSMRRANAATIDSAETAIQYLSANDEISCTEEGTSSPHRFWQRLCGRSLLRPTR